MAAVQPFVNLQPFKGTEKENLQEFRRQLESCMTVAGIADAQRHRYLHLHLKGGALSYFDQLPAATRADYDLAIAALTERYQNDQRIQLQKLLFQARKMKVSEESSQDFLTELQRLALEAYPNIVARAAAGGRPAVNAEDRAQERTRRVKEAFVNGIPIKIRRFLLTLPDETTVEDLCAKAASRIIVDRLYPEDDDSAFNEIRGTSTKDFFAGIEELSKAQTKFNENTTKITEELKELTKNIGSTSINEMAQTSKLNKTSNKATIITTTTITITEATIEDEVTTEAIIEAITEETTGETTEETSDSKALEDHTTISKTGTTQINGRMTHTASSQGESTATNCWFRPQYRGPPPLPYTTAAPQQYTAQPQMNEMIPQQQAPPNWSPHYDCNFHHQDQKN